MLACHSKVKEEFMVLSVVNDNASGERGSKLFICGFFTDFLQRFLRQSFPLSSLSNVQVPRLIHNELALGWRQEEEQEEEEEEWQL